MPFIKEILKHKSLSIVGIAKNTGKTECLNYVLRRLSSEKKNIAITSIGIDGEGLDQVTLTPKPDITLFPGMLFSTSEIHYKSRKIISELLDITQESSALGRIVTAKALSQGKILLSGPSSGDSLKRWMNGLERFNIDLTIIDGALSRLSSASPAISEAMILATGAAYSANINTLVQRTAFVINLIKLPQASKEDIARFSDKNNGMWILNSDGTLTNTDIKSSLLVSEFSANFTENIASIYIAGALTENMLKTIIQQKKNKPITLIVRDFTKIFIEKATYYHFLKSGGEIRTLQRSEIMAICVNPTSPNGYNLDSQQVIDKLSETLHLPVYDIVKNNYAI